jgi:enoyl-[acyl-carrier protein] reductase I
MSNLMYNRKGLVLGIANKHSIAWQIAQKLYEQGAIIGVTYFNEATEKRVRKLASNIGIEFIKPCDVQNDIHIQTVCDEFFNQYGSIDFIVHSIAYARREELENGFINTTRKGFLETMDISVYSLVAFCRSAKPYFSEDANVISLSYIGAQRVCTGYNLMGIAKAALNASCRYLAEDLGAQGIRVNIISAGPLRTSAALGLPNFKETLEKRAQMSPLRKNITQEDVANSSVFLLSNLSQGITGEVINVDSGYNIMGTWKN